MSYCNFTLEMFSSPFLLAQTVFFYYLCNLVEVLVHIFFTYLNFLYIDKAQVLALCTICTFK